MIFDPDLVPDRTNPERKSYKHVLLEGRLKDALHRLNPGLAAVAIADALGVLANAATPELLAANLEFQRWLTPAICLAARMLPEASSIFDLASSVCLVALMNRYSVPALPLSKHTCSHSLHDPIELAQDWSPA